MDSDLSFSGIFAMIAGAGVNGRLTVQANVSDATQPPIENLTFLAAYVQSIPIITSDGAGNLGIVNPSPFGGNSTIGWDQDGAGIQLKPAGGTAHEYNFTTGGLSKFNGIATAGNGLTPERGIDDRANVTSADGAAITVFAVGASAAKYRISATIAGRNGTITSGVYTIKYTLRGVVISRTVSISAVDTDSSTSLIASCDNGTNITAQITTLTGTSPAVDVTCLVEAVSAGF